MNNILLNKSHPKYKMEVLILLVICITISIISCNTHESIDKELRLVGHWTTPDGWHRYYGPPDQLNLGYYFENIDGKTITGSYIFGQESSDGTRVRYTVGSPDIENTFAQFECTLSDNDMKMTGCGGEYSYVGKK